MTAGSWVRLSWTCAHLLNTPFNGVPEEGGENEKFTAESASTILHACARQPGTLPDGTVTADAAFTYVNKVRELAKESDRLEICDSQLGQITARGRTDTDGFSIRAIP